MMLSDENKKYILELQSKYPQKRSALLPALHIAQKQEGYLPREIQNEVADLFEIDPNEVNAVVTFYDMFYEEPVGKHLIHVCKNISCMLNGADALLVKLCQKVHEQPAGEFTVIASECLGACDLAPLFLVDEKVVGPIKEEDLESILNEAKNG